jgi:membrane-associated phospholipid phosphatase
MEKRNTRFLILTLGMVLATLIAVSFLLRKGDDVLLVNGNHSPEMDVFFYYITCLGNGYLLVAVILLATLHSFRLSVTVLTTSVVAGLIGAVVKKVLSLPRPAKFMGRDAIHLVFDVDLHIRNSFPSGHTATAFCIATVLALYFRNNVLSVGLITVALLVGISRVYLGQHFIADVAGGAVLGGGCGLIFYYYLSRACQPWLDKRFVISLPTNRQPMPRSGTR